MFTEEQRELVLKEFTTGFIEYMRDNQDIFNEFTDAWYNADNYKVRSIVDDYLIEYESQS